MMLPRSRWLVVCAVAANLAASVGGAAPAAADGELTARGMYYKEKATRVMQPMFDALFDVGERGSGEAHFLIDAITSASANGSAVPFTEKRYEGGAGYQRQLERLRFGGRGRLSYEPDYTSVYGAVRGDVELLDKNVTLSATFGAGQDWISNAGARMAERIEDELTTLLGSVSVSQVVSEHGVVGLSYDVIRLDGFQQNPYRTVSGGGMIALERHPRQRTRHALGASIKWFFPAQATTLVGQYRFYADDWDVRAHTPEVRLAKDIGEWITAGVRYRYHRQDAAEFYKTMYSTLAPAVEPHVSADVKLSEFDGHMIGARFELTLGGLGLEGRLEAARIELAGEYVVQNNRFGNALVSYAALVLPFDY